METLPSTEQPNDDMSDISNNLEETEEESNPHLLSPLRLLVASGVRDITEYSNFVVNEEDNSVFLECLRIMYYVNCVPSHFWSRCLEITFDQIGFLCRPLLFELQYIASKMELNEDIQEALIKNLDGAKFHVKCALHDFIDHIQHHDTEGALATLHHYTIACDQYERIASLYFINQPRSASVSLHFADYLTKLRGSYKNGHAVAQRATMLSYGHYSFVNNSINQIENRYPPITFPSLGDEMINDATLQQQIAAEQAITQLHSSHIYSVIAAFAAIVVVYLVMTVSLPYLTSDNIKNIKDSTFIEEICVYTFLPWSNRQMEMLSLWATLTNHAQSDTIEKVYAYLQWLPFYSDILQESHYNITQVINYIQMRAGPMPGIADAWFGRVVFNGIPISLMFLDTTMTASYNMVKANAANTDIVESVVISGFDNLIEMGKRFIFLMNNATQTREEMMASSVLIMGWFLGSVILFAIIITIVIVIFLIKFLRQEKVKLVEIFEKVDSESLQIYMRNLEDAEARPNETSFHEHDNVDDDDISLVPDEFEMSEHSAGLSIISPDQTFAFEELSLFDPVRPLTLLVYIILFEVLATVLMSIFTGIAIDTYDSEMARFDGFKMLSSTTNSIVWNCLSNLMSFVEPRNVTKLVHISLGDSVVDELFDRYSAAADAFQEDPSPENTHVLGEIAFNQFIPMYLNHPLSQWTIDTFIDPVSITAHVQLIVIFMAVLLVIAFTRFVVRDFRLFASIRSISLIVPSRYFSIMSAELELFERKHSELEDATTSVQSRLILEHASSPIIACSCKTLSIIDINQAAQSVLMYKRETFTSRNLTDIITLTSETQDFYNFIKHPLEETMVYTVNVKKSDGSTMICRCTVFGVQDESDSVVVLIFHDLSQYNILKERLRKARKRCESLMRQILPLQMVERVFHENEQLQIHVPSATIVVMGQTHFDDFSAKHAHTEITNTLDLLFAKFDQQLALYPTFVKIRVMNGMYCVGGNLFEPAPASEHAPTALEFASSVVASIRDRNKRFGSAFEIAFGISTGGPVESGVLSGNRPLFNCWGHVPMEAYLLFEKAKGWHALVSPLTLQNIDRKRYKAKLIKLPELSQADLGVAHQILIK